MASITAQKGKRGTTWKVRIRMPNTPTVTKTFSSKSLAEKWARKTEVDIEEGAYFEKAEAARHTVAELIERYLKEELRKLSEADWSKRTGHLEWWKDQIGTLTLSKVSPAILVECKNKLIEKGLKGSTVNRYLASLRKPFALASTEWQWIEKNPFAKVRQEKEGDPVTRFLSPDERTALLKECNNSRNDDLYLVVLLALSTGMRASEIMSIKWDAVDFKRKTITLPKTKNGSVRVVPLVGKAAEEMKQRNKVVVLKNPYVFVSRIEEGEHAKFPDTPWRTAVKKSGVENFRFHDCRHSAASELAMNGASLHEIAAVLGHKTLQMVQRYAHLSEQHTIAVVERMNQAVFGD